MTRRFPASFHPPGATNALVASVIVICGLVELVLQAAQWGVLNAPQLRSLAFENGAFWPGLLDGWRPNYPLQPWTMFLTHGFLHGGALHLLLNMMTLYSLAIPILARIGTLRFALVYFGSMVGGGAVYALLATSSQPMVGASGALFGLAGALLAWQWDDQRTLRQAFRATWRALVLLVVLNIALYFLLQGSLAWQTHLGGFLAGWILGLAVDPASTTRTGSR